LLVADKDLLVRTKGSTIASIASITLIALGHSHLGGHILLVARRELFGAEVGGRGGAAGMSQETGERRRRVMEWSKVRAITRMIPRGSTRQSTSRPWSVLENAGGGTSVLWDLARVSANGTMTTTVYFYFCFFESWHQDRSQNTYSADMREVLPVTTTKSRDINLPSTRFVRDTLDVMDGSRPVRYHNSW
jgi:hypothetical protein